MDRKKCVKMLTLNLFVAGLFVLPTITLAGNTPTNTPTNTPMTSTSASSPAAQTVAPHQAKTERHPLIHKAMENLERAKKNLEHAKRDFGGHRVRAIQHIDQAMEELHLALQSDKQ